MRENLLLCLLDDLIVQAYRTLKKELNKTAKVGDWIKMIELRRKLEPDEASQAELWQKLEDIRRDLLPEEGMPTTEQNHPATNLQEHTDD